MDIINVHNYHQLWQKNRLSYVLSNFGKDFFKDKKILEVGPCNGFFGASLHELGAKLLLVEGRMENVNVIKSNYPFLDVIQGDFDKKEWNYGHFDIILNFGVLYHLNNFHKEHISNCVKNSDLLLLETVVYDSAEDELFVRQENGFDQSLSGYAGTPSTSFVENVFKEENVSYEKHSSGLMNGGYHKYDWPDLNSKIFDQHNRRMWFVKRK